MNDVDVDVDVDPRTLPIEPLDFGHCGRSGKTSVDWIEPKQLHTATNVCEFFQCANNYMFQPNKWTNIYVARKDLLPSWSSGLLKNKKGHDLTLAWKGLKLEDFQNYVKYILVNFVEPPVNQQIDTKYGQWEHILCFEFEFKNFHKEATASIKVWGSEKLDTFLLESEIKEQIRDFSPPEPRCARRTWPR